ncbi:MAG: FtsX-like permease family protein, partial [Longimicrobiales bacterium]
LEAIGTPLIAGRTFTTADDAASPPVLVINQQLAERYFAGRDPIGGRIVVGGGGPPFTVVGVVADLRHNALTEAAKPQFYGPHAQLGGFLQRDMTLVVHTARDPVALIGPIREQVRLLDPRLPISGVRTMRDVVAASIAQPRFTLALLGVFGALALALAVIGVYGVVAQVVAARRQEIGIRIALGAHARDVVWLSLRSGLAQTALGLAIGAAAALALTRVMSGLVYGVSTTDAFTFIAALAVAAIVSLAASVLPARRAAGVDPVAELRRE